MVHEEAPFTKEDLLIVIWKSWNNFDKEYCFKFVKSMPQRTKAIIKAWGVVTKY